MSFTIYEQLLHLFIVISFNEKAFSKTIYVLTSFYNIK